MSARVWKQGQRDAISSRDGKFLISAGAGSGKTAVLTERVFQMVKEGVDLSQILVLTFTNKAAFEMKRRIREAILAEPSLSHLSGRIESANIATFDAYALSIVRKYHYELGLSPDISIINEIIDSVTVKKFLDEILDEYYSSNGADFKAMIFKYLINDDAKLKEFIVKIYDDACLRIDKNEFLDTYLEKVATNENYSLWLNDYVQLEKSKLSILRRHTTGILDEIECASLDLISNIDDFDALQNSLRGIKITKPSDIDQSYWKEIKGLKDEIKEMAHLDSKANILSKMSDDRNYLSIIIDIIKELDSRLFSFKKHRNAFKFKDIASMAFDLVKIPRIKKEIKSSIKYIMIDEYQDTSDVQNAFIEEISSGNTFFVGDIKQSIYRFRNANPSIFKEKIHEACQGNGKLITLDYNFRSRPQVIDDINEMFSKIMSERVGGVDYRDGHSLKAGKTEFETSGHTDQNYSLEFYLYPTDNPSRDYDEQNDDAMDNDGEEIEIFDDAALIEANLIADDIIAKMNSGYLVFDGAGLRKCLFSDFVILLDRRSKYDLYQKVLTDRNIPLVNDASPDIKFQDVAMLLTSILKFIRDYRHRDETKYGHYYASIARSYIFREADQNIYDIVHQNKIKETEIFKKIAVLAEKADNMFLADFLAKLIDKFGIVENFVFLGDIESNKATIEGIVEMVRDMDKLGDDFDDLIGFFDDLKSYDIKLNIDADMSISSSVRMMTIHSSKGLEFPIIYYAGLSRRFNRSSYTSSFVVSSKYGASFPNISSEHFLNPLQVLNRNMMDEEELSEKMRLLYVALTRCQEKAIVLFPRDLKNAPKLIDNSNSLGHLLNFAFPSVHKIDRSLMIPSPKLMVENKCDYAIAKFEMPEIEALPQKIEYKRASKEFSLSYSADALAFGQRMHSLMELIDFKNPDLSFVKDDKERFYIERALRNPIFDEVSNGQIFHEYEFFDQELDYHGVIDLLIIYDDHVDIVDYKLKRIDDNEYDDQLHAYANFVIKRTGKSVNKYLLSLLDGTLRVVK
ncbi:MAG: UvrD-helicase domain-containing protein [Bacilli bacterium]|jgi:ATP-dependent helicase/nuclease subunit A